MEVSKMKFEIYKPRIKKEAKSIVSLSKNSIVLNKVAREKLNASSIELAYDRDTNIIRIKPSADGQTVKKTKVFARGFFNQFNITKKGRFAAEFKENALFVDLNKNLP
jgi:hypothetical protein